jgi:hypothetical protein
VAFEFSSEYLEIVHVFNRILGIAMSRELNYGMTLVTARAGVLRELDALNVTEWAKPLQGGKLKLSLTCLMSPSDT